MPNRILRENILTSDRVVSLSWAGEVFYRRLMSVVDDYGRFDGRPGIIRTRLYPLQVDKVKEPDIQKWIDETAKAGLIVAYTVDDKPYLELLRFGQKIRAASKYPSPADSCAQVRADVDKSAVFVCASECVSECDASATPEAESEIPSDPPKAWRPTATKSQIESLYQAYPRKVGKEDALKAIAKAIKKLDAEGRDGQAYLLDRVMTYAKAVAGKDKQFIPHPATWFNRGSYDDDPAEWEAGQDPEEDEGGSMAQMSRADRDRLFASLPKDLCF